MAFKRKNSSIRKIEELLQNDFDYNREDLLKKEEIIANCRLCDVEIKFQFVAHLRKHIKSFKHENLLSRLRKKQPSDINIIFDTPTNSGSNFTMPISNTTLIEHHPSINDDNDDGIIFMDPDINLYNENKELKKQLELLKEENASLSNLKQINDILTGAQKTNMHEINSLNTTIKLLKDEKANLEAILREDKNSEKLKLIQKKLVEVQKENQRLRNKNNNLDSFIFKQENSSDISKKLNDSYEQIENLKLQINQLNSLVNAYEKQASSISNKQIPSESQTKAFLPT